MKKIKVRIIRPDYRSAMMGYTKGRIMEVAEDVALRWFQTKYAEPVESELETAALAPMRNAAQPKGKLRRKVS